MYSVNPQHYPQQLEEKQQSILQLFNDVSLPEIEIFPSPPTHFRMRAEFRIWHEGDASFYAMTPPGGSGPQPIERFDIGSDTMVALMPKLLAAITGEPLLRKKLYACEFLTTLSSEVLVTLIYHRPLDEAWDACAHQVARSLNIHLIGRSRKQKRVLSQDFVTERLNVNGKCYEYQQVETGFTQPNARVNEKMLSWAQRVSADSQGDLLELYCGNGNFTLPLSQNFDRVLATELAKISVRSAHFNLERNGINNVKLVRMSSEEITQALNGERPFRRLREIDLPGYDFSTVFVDPPRAGLDASTLELVSRFKKILYISCNPASLRENIDVLRRSHRITHFALFDQFPYTHHVECGLLLEANAL
jgi:tRNA (uracil-5-)-methyltransferase